MAKGPFDDDFDQFGATPTTAVVTPSPKKKGAHDDDFDQFGAMPPQPKPKDPAKIKALENSPNDTALTQGLKFGATAINKGLSHIPGFVGDQAGFADYLIARAQSAVTGKPLEAVQADLANRRAQFQQSATPIGQLANAIDPARVLPSSGDIQNKLFSATGEYKPETPLGRVGMAAAETVIGSAAPGMVGKGMAMNPVQSAVSSAPVMATMGGLGQGVADATGDPLAGVVAGMAVPAAGAAARGLGRSMAGTLSQEQAQLASAAANKYNIPLGVGDLSNKLPIRMANSVAERLPFSGAQSKIENKQQAFNAAVGSTFGENSPVLTREVMARARDRIVSYFDLVARYTKIVPDAQLTRDFANIVNNTKLGPQGSEARIMANLQEIGSRIQRNGGVIDGKTYQDLTRVGGNSKGAGLVQKLASDPDPTIREAGSALRTALDDALQRHAPPDMIPILQQARSQYRNMRTVEDLVAKAPDGNISPALLQGRVNAKGKGTYGRAYQQGGNLGELADIGQAFLKQPGSSNTAERAMLMNLAPAAAGNLIALGSGNPWHGVAGMMIPAATMAGGRAANAIMSNPNMGNALINRSLGLPPVGVGNQGYSLPLPYLPLPPSQ
jgi:hypothetical protein